MFKSNKIWLILLLIVTIANITFAQDIKIRIGVYDSRAITVVYVRSEYFKKEAQVLDAEYQKAKEKNDAVLMEKLAEKGELRQRILHDQGYGRGSVIAMLEKVQYAVESVGKKAKVAAIVSKWELIEINNLGLEKIDLTDEIVEAFKPTDQVRKMVKDLAKHKPVEDAFFIED